MKKSIKILATALMMLLLMAFCGCGSKETLKIYLPGEYMSEELVPNFEKLYNCKVDVELFESNEMMYTKLSAGDSYDILIPSDYMIERLIKEKMLMTLDKSKFTNFDNLVDDVINAPYNSFDPDNTYSIPYFWGTAGIVYNADNVSYDDIVKEGYEIFKDTRYAGKIYMYDSERDGFMIALKALGYSVNTENEDEINEAYNWLVELNQTMDPIYVIDEVIDNMAQGRKDIALVYSGDAAYILGENESMRYYTPECGTNVWVDSMVIPANAENPELAYKFIDYVISYEAALDNTSEVGYTSVNKKVLAEVTAEDGEFFGNEAYLPKTDRPNDEIYHDNETIRRLFSDLWLKVKASK